MMIKETYEEEDKQPINLIPKFEDTNNLENALAMFAKADSLKKENNKKIIIIILKVVYLKIKI